MISEAYPQPTTRWHAPSFWQRLFSLNLIDFYVASLAIIIIFIAYLDLGNYIQVITHGGIPPKYIYFALAGAILPLLPLRVGILFKYSKNRYSMWTVALVTLNIVHWMAIVAYGNAEQASLILTRIQFLLLGAGLGFVLVQSSPTLLAWTFVTVALILSGLQVFDFLSPDIIVPTGTEGVSVGRTGSTLVNANKAAESLLMLAVLGMATLRPGWRLVLFLLIFPGIAVSFSRAGVMVWLLVVVMGAWFRLLPRTGVIACASVTVIFLVVFGSTLQSGILSYVDFAGLENLVSRISFLTTLNTGDESAQERFAVVRYAMQSFFDQPLVGNGAGFTFFWSFSNVSTHNQHFLILSEYGLLGYLLFAWLFVLIYKGGEYFKHLDVHRLRWLAFAAFCLFTPFTHNMFDNLYWLITIALLCQRKIYWNGVLKPRYSNDR